MEDRCAKASGDIGGIWQSPLCLPLDGGDLVGVLIGIWTWLVEIGVRLWCCLLFRDENLVV